MKLLICAIFCFSISFTISNAFSLIPPPPGNECKAPNGDKGLGAALREIIDLIPFTKIAKIYIHAVSNDPEVEAAMEYIESDEFKSIVKAIHDTKQFSEILEYICNELYFNSYFYLNALENLLGFPVMPKPPHHYKFNVLLGNRARAGFEGFLLDIRDALPLDEIKQVYKKRYETDKYLKLAIQKIGSPEFQQIGDRVQEMPEYKHMLQKLRNVHVDVDKILKSLSNFFGWKIHTY